MQSLLDRAVVPHRLALIYRDQQTTCYNPVLNLWERISCEISEVLRWLRASRPKSELAKHLANRFDLSGSEAETLLLKSITWCVFRKLLYLDNNITKLNIKYDKLPLDTLYWVCTQACNLRCTYCYQEALVALPNELTTDEAKDLIQQAQQIGIQTFIFTGGEPFSRRDLLPLAKYAKSLGLKVNVITNGHYINERNIRKIASEFDQFTVSLDHGKAQIHDAERGLGSWIRASKAIKLLRENGATVDVNSVLTKQGASSVDEMMQLSRRFDVADHRIVPQFPMGRGDESEGNEINPTEILAINDTMHSASCAAEAQRDTPVGLEGSYNSKGVLRNHCGAGLSEIAVSPEGWVYPCKLLQFEEFKKFNVRDENLSEIFSTHLDGVDTAQITSDKIDTCKTCIVQSHCGGGCRGIHYAFSKSYSKSHPLFCAYLRSSFELQMWRSTGEVPKPRRLKFSDQQKARRELDGKVVSL